MASRAKCYDCGRLYGDKYGFPDLIIPNWAWKRISPYHNLIGLLCPSCICKRLHEAKIQDCPSAFTSGPLTFDVRSWINQKPPEGG